MCNKITKRGKKKILAYIMLFLILICVVSFIVLISYTNTRDDNTDKIDSNMLNGMTASNDRFDNISITVANASIGLRISTQDRENAEKLGNNIGIVDIQNILNTNIIGSPETENEDIDNQLESLVGGTDNNSIDIDKQMYILEKYYYYPDIFVYKLINNNGNTAIVTIEADLNGGIEHVDIA